MKQRIDRPAWRVAAALFMLATVGLLAIPSTAQDAPPDEPVVEPVEVDPTIQAVWDMTDGQIVSGAAQRAWAFGPEPIAAAYEYYPQSPTSFREIVYYDKGRLDLLNPQAPPGSIWMVSGALLASELLSGRIQLGEEQFVEREPADIALVGDLDQPEPVTYATLATHSSVAGPEDDRTTQQAARTESNRNLEQVGKHVTEMLHADGSITPGLVTDHDVTIVAYEELLGHNVASPFAGWATSLGLPALNLLGLPVTEPYWIETLIDGDPTLVLIQAFERRTLTYTPSNPEGWRVESGNVGLHYRLWRGLERPERPELARLAAEIPFGEEVLSAAREAFIDPYIFVSISLNSTGGNPFETSINGGHGLMGARADDEDSEVDLRDPGVNANVAAAQFAGEMYEAWDWPAILANFYLLDNTDATGQDAEAWAEAVLTTSERLLAHYPPTGPRVDPVREEGKAIGEGRAAHYSPSYDTAWWEGAMSRHASWGNAVDTWQVDPQGFYCVHPDYFVGERLKLEANERVLECTIGDRVAEPHQLGWRSRWAVELSWSAFTALGLDRNNEVAVSYLGDRIIEPTPSPTTEPTPTEMEQIPGQAPAGGNGDTPDPTASPTSQPPEPSATVSPTATPEPEVSETPTAEATPP